MKILIVDDRHEDRYLLRRIAEQHGHEVLEAANGEQGLETAASQEPDLIISDVMMPVMDGFRFLRAVKADARLKTTPFIFYSVTYQENKDVELALTLGAAAYINKPREPQELWEAVEKALREGSREMSAATPPTPEEEEYLRRYSDVVATKLEQKVQELEREIVVRKAAEEHLRESEVFAKGILESVGEGLIVIDPSYRIISANRAFCEMHKTTVEETVGRHCHEVSHRRPRPCFMNGDDCAPQRSFKTGAPALAIHTHIESGGSPVHIETRSFPMRNASGEIVACIETLNNITEKRGLEEQLRHAQKMEAIGTLAGGIAHDFNNLLNVIIGYGGLMQLRMESDSPFLPQLREILAAGERAAQLTKGLLTFSRKQIMEMKAVDLNETVKGFRKMLVRMIGEDVEIRIAIAKARLIVMADVVQIEQVLMNLATNARDAMPRGGSFTIETSPFRMDSAFVQDQGFGEPGEYALLTVADTGTGIKDETKKRLFEPFFTTKEIGKGTGLGLSIVYGIVKQHKGYIACSSVFGRGTTFKIYLPRLGSAADGAEIAEAAAVAGGTETVLLAEDDAAVRDLIKQTLEAYGYTVVVAGDGEEAVRRFVENKGGIGLLLFDLIMPKKNGKDAYQEIAALRPGVKAVFMSGYSLDIIRRLGLDEGAVFISKPVTPAELLRKVRETLDRREEGPATDI